MKGFDLKMDAIDKRLSVIEYSLASVAWLKAKTSVCTRDTVSSSLTESSVKESLYSKLPNLHTSRHDRLIQEQVEE